MQHPELPERERGEKRLQQVRRASFLSFPFLTFTFSFHFLLSIFLFTVREELLEFWDPGQCSAQQYEELEGLEEFAYEDEDDEDEFYEDEDEGT